MNNFIKITLIFIFITSCSFQKNSKFWTKQKIIKEKKEDVVKILKKNEVNLISEFNSNFYIKLYSKTKNQSFLNNFDNNNGRINFNGNLKNISKYKFAKIKNFHQYDPQLSFYKNDIIFFDNKGTILRFNNDSDLIWKKNIYTKSEKKKNPILFLENDKKILIVADNIAKYYAIDIDTGELLWSKNNTAPFNSQIKRYKDKFFLIDFENILRAYSVKDGKEIWNMITENSFIRTQKKLSMVIVDGKIYFNNYSGDISSVDIESGELLWQTPTQSKITYDESFFLMTSDIVADKNAIYFSNNNNKFFSLNIQTGFLNWTQKINSNLRPTLIDNYIFTVSLDGHLFVVEKDSGNILRITDVFKNFKIKTKNKIQPTGFIVGNKNIYLTTSHGRLVVLDVATSKILSVIKINNKMISRPLVLNDNLFIITDNSIHKLN